MQYLELYSQHYIFFITNKWVQYASLLHGIMLQRLTNVKNSNLLVQLVSYKEKEVLWIQSMVFYSGLVLPKLLSNI
jgi:hypothetical protein